MSILYRLCALAICLSACTPTPSYDFENIDFSNWEEARINELNILLPEIKELYLEANPNRKKYKGKEITIGVLSNYTELMEYAYLPGRSELYTAKSGNRLGDVIILNPPHEVYKTNQLSGPKDFVIFNPKISYSKHTYKTCDLECENLIFENRVKSITIVNETRRTTKKAIRYSIAQCSEQDSEIDRNQKRKFKQPEFITDFDAEYCLVEENVDVPKYGYFADRSSPLWPKELVSRNKRLDVFKGLKNIKTSISNVDHWSYTSPAAPNPTLRYEKLCLKVSPELPDKAVKLLTDNLAKNRKTHVYSQSGTKGRISIVTLKNGDINVAEGQTVFYARRKITHENGNLCFEPAFSWTNRTIRGPSYSRLGLGNASTAKEIIEKLNDYKFDEPIVARDQSGETENGNQIETRRDIYLRELGFLAKRPDYYEDIFPAIAPRFFDKTQNGLGADDGSILAEHFFKSSPPLGSLSSYAEETEKLFEKRLKTLGCTGWDCPPEIADKFVLTAHYNILAALGSAGLPLLEKIENLEGQPTKEIELCLGELTPKTTQKYLELLRNSPDQKVTVNKKNQWMRPKHHIRALLMTEHRVEVFAHLEKRLSYLQNEALAEKDDETVFTTRRVNFINGIPTDFFSTSVGKRYVEIKSIEALLHQYQSSNPPVICSFHMVSLY